MSSSPPPYEVISLPVFLQQLRLCRDLAQLQGAMDSFHAVLVSLRTMLTQTPATWGDPIYSLPHLGLLVYQRLSPPLYVTYAVDEANRIVYLRSVAWHAGAG